MNTAEPITILAFGNRVLLTVSRDDLEAAVEPLLFELVTDDLTVDVTFKVSNAPRITDGYARVE